MSDEANASPETPALAEHVETVAATEAELAAQAKTASVHAAIDAWVVERLHNSPLSRATDVWNYFATTVDDLKARLS